MLAITAGLRQGEILGPKWEDIDLEEGVVRVRRTLTRDKGRQPSWVAYLPNPRDSIDEERTHGIDVSLLL